MQDSDVRTLTDLDAAEWTPWLKQCLSRLRGLTAVTVGKMTALQELNIKSCTKLEAVETVEKLRHLIVQYSLARMTVISNLLSDVLDEGKQLACKWITARGY